jgi:exodeoxyribonuclease VII small subunit
MAKTKMTFEESMSRLEEIVSELEKNEKPLDETITLFEEGLQLVKSCDEKLKGYEAKIDQLVKNNGSETTDEN